MRASPSDSLENGEKERRAETATRTRRIFLLFFELTTKEDRPSGNNSGRIADS